MIFGLFFALRGELMHMDTWGPYPIGGIGKIKGFVVLTDDACRFVWTKSYEKQEHIIDISIDMFKSLETAHTIQIRKAFQNLTMETNASIMF